MKAKTKKINVGISLLRIWMCFEVILCHFKYWDNEPILFPYNYLKSFQNLAVPTFMLLAFILTDINKFSKDENKIKNRYYRLVLPQVFWTIIYFLLYYILDYFLNTKLENGIKDFFFQLILGHSINKALWFQINLIWLTTLFIFVFKKFKKEKAIKITLILGVLAIFLEYSNINYAVFNVYIKLPSNIETYIIYPLGRFIEVLPYAVVGILINQYKLLDKLKKYKTYIILISIIVLIVLPLKENNLLIPLGYQYQGILKIIISICLLCTFYYMSFDKINEKVKLFINNIAKLTMGVYFIHNLVGTLIFQTNILKYTGSLKDSILIYIISLTIVFILSKVPIKYIKDSVV